MCVVLKFVEARFCSPPEGILYETENREWQALHVLTTAAGEEERCKDSEEKYSPTSALGMCGS